MKQDLQNPLIIKILEDSKDISRRKELIDIIEEIPEPIIVTTENMSKTILNTFYENNNFFWNIPYLIKLNDVDRPIFYITKDDIIDTMLNPSKPDTDKLIYFYMIFRHKKRHYGL